MKMSGTVPIHSDGDLFKKEATAINELTVGSHPFIFALKNKNNNSKLFRPISERGTKHSTRQPSITG